MFDKFENAAEYALDENCDIAVISHLLTETHFLVRCLELEQKNTFLFVSHDLYHEKGLENNINKTLKSCYNSRSSTTSGSGETGFVILINIKSLFVWEGEVVNNLKVSCPVTIKENHLRIVSMYSDQLQTCKEKFQETMEDLDIIVTQVRLANHTQINEKLLSIKKQCYFLGKSITQSVDIIKRPFKNNNNQNVAEIIENCYAFSAEFCQRVLKILDIYHRFQLVSIMIRLSIDWVRFVCNDCDSSDRKTFRWTVIALEFIMNMTQGNNIHSLSEYEFDCLRCNVAGCMTLLISHFDIQGARGTHEITFRKDFIKNQKIDSVKVDPLDILKSPSIASNIISYDKRSQKINQRLMDKLEALEKTIDRSYSLRKNVGKVLDNERPENKSLLFLASGNSNISIRWQQGKFLGSGTFGSVYLAVNLDSGDIMAVKEFRFLDTSQLVSLYKSIKEEMSVMEIMNHPNIVSYYGIEVHRDKVYLFMEYCQGGTLAKLLEHGGIEDEDVIRIYTCQMLRGLCYLHENNILHRDVKPDNMLLDHKGVLKFVDFGAAKIAKNQKTFKNASVVNEPKSIKNKGKESLVGTPMYMAPEVITGKDEGCRGAQDIWSLGCCVLEMITGKRPWSNLDNEWAIMYHIVTGHPPLPDDSQISSSGLEFLKLCFSPKPQLRPTAKALLEHRWFDGIETIEQKLTMTKINGNNITTINENAVSSFSLESNNEDTHNSSEGLKRDNYK